jgi:hypothetical protein
VPAAGLLEPEQVAVGHQAGKADRLGRAPALVGVGGEQEAGPARLPGGAEALGVLLGGQAADLELHPGEAALLDLGHLGGDVGVGAVVAADRDHRQAVAVPAPQAPERPAVGLAERVPERRVHGRADAAG